jgi:DNA-binding transcriptional LysR family regulator
MARTEWLRTFVQAYQVGSVSEAARLRSISQPSATSHIRSLEAAAGAPLFVRRREGIVPTEAGRRLFAQVADPLDRLEEVFAGLDTGTLPPPPSPLRVGASPEMFAGMVIPHLTALGVPVSAVFGTDEELHRRLLLGEADAVITATPMSRKGLSARVVGRYRYTLVAPPGVFGSVADLDGLAASVEGIPWVSYSSDLPTTRSFWKRHLGRPFDADLRLVAPDLRVVLSAVEAGLGSSLLPTMVCRSAIARGSVIEPFSVEDLVEPRPIWLTARPGSPPQSALTAFLESFGTPIGG